MEIHYTYLEDANMPIITLEVLTTPLLNQRQVENENVVTVTPAIGDHFLTETQEEGKIEENEEDMNAKGRGELLEYILRHDGRVVCKLCGEILQSRTQWYRHKYKLHVIQPLNPTPLFQCETCLVYFKSRKGYIGHIASRHSDVLSEVSASQTHTQAMETNLQPIESHVQPIEAHAQPIETHAQPIETHVQSSETTVNPIQTNAQSIKVNIQPGQKNVQAIQKNVQPSQKKIPPIKINILQKNVQPIQKSVQTIQKTVPPIKINLQALQKKLQASQTNVQPVQKNALPPSETIAKETTQPVPTNQEIKEEPIDPEIYIQSPNQELTIKQVPLKPIDPKKPCKSSRGTETEDKSTWEARRTREEKLVADIIARVRRECEAAGTPGSNPARRCYNRRTTVMHT